MKKLLCIFFLAVIFEVHGQNKIAKELYSIEELKQDFDVFRSALEEGHPALYRYKSRSKMDSIFTAASGSINKQMTDREFMLLICRITAQVGDGHLKVSLPAIHKEKLDEGSAAAPFRIYWNNDQLYISRIYSPLTNQDLLGSRIVSINQHPVDDFLKDYVLIATSDGNNLTNKYRMLQRPRFFARYFNYLYGYTDSYELTYIPINETRAKNILLPGLSFDELFRLDEKLYPSGAALAPAEFTVSAMEKLAYLRISSFDKDLFKDKKMNFEKFLDTSFTSMEKHHINNLILDLRGNPGGSDEYGKILFSYFATQPFDYYSALQMNKESFDFFKYTNRPGMRTPKGMLKANNEGSFDNLIHPNAGKQNPRLPAFTGNIYVLINGGCFSTTSEFLSMLHYHTKAVFIGEESGGGYYGNSSGPTPELKLPNSKIGIEIPLMKYVMAVKGYPYPDRGLIPNHTISPSIKDRIDNKDVELEFAKKLIGN